VFCKNQKKSRKRESGRKENGPDPGVPKRSSPIFGREAPALRHGDERPPPDVEIKKRLLQTGPFPVGSSHRPRHSLGSNSYRPSNSP